MWLIKYSSTNKGKSIVRVIFAVSSLLFLFACSGELDRPLYPLDEGQSWDYQVSMDRGGRSANLDVTVTNMPQRDLGDQQVVPQKTEFTTENGVSQTSFGFIVSDDTGIYVYAEQSADATEPKILSEPNYRLKYPLEAGATWEGEGKTQFLKNEVSVPVQTTVQATDTVVTVPAGTFEKCVKTRTEGETTINPGYSLADEAEISIEGHGWFCPEVGLVKSIREEDNNSDYGSVQFSMQLTSFEEQ